VIYSQTAASGDIADGLPVAEHRGQRSDDVRDAAEDLRDAVGGAGLSDHEGRGGARRDDGDHDDDGDVGAIRLALGQILDYVRSVQPDSTAALLPRRPSTDLCALLKSNDVNVIWPGGDGFGRD
jgi:hypothetical protein